MNKESTEENIEKIFDFLHSIENLKNTFRWNKTSKGRQESTAEHSWQLAIMAMIVADELQLKVDINHAIKIALAHDLAEAITEDVTYGDIVRGKVSKSDKEKMEFNTMLKLQESLPEKIGIEIMSLWKEYDECQTEEAKFIKALDKLETTTQQIEMDLSVDVDQDIDGYKCIATYPNKAMQFYPQLEPVWKIVKQKLKAKYASYNVPWKEEYDKI